MADDGLVVLDPEYPEYEVTSGVGLEAMRGVDLSFLPQLRADTPMDERKGLLRDSAKKFVGLGDKFQLAQAEVLYEIFENQTWRDWSFQDADGSTHVFRSQEEYIEKELDIPRRKVFYLTGLYKKFVVELGIPAKILVELNWSKAAIIKSLVNEDNWPDMIERIKTMTAEQLRDYAKDMRDNGSSTHEPGTTKRFSVSLHADQYETLLNSLDAAKKMTGMESEAAALDLIATEFLGTAAGAGLHGAMTSLEIILNSIERAYGVKVEVKNVDSERLDALASAEAKETIKS